MLGVCVDGFLCLCAVLMGLADIPTHPIRSQNNVSRPAMCRALQVCAQALPLHPLPRLRHHCGGVHAAEGGASWLWCGVRGVFGWWVGVGGWVEGSKAHGGWGLPRCRRARHPLDPDRSLLPWRRLLGSSAGRQPGAECGWLHWGAVPGPTQLGWAAGWLFSGWMEPSKMPCILCCGVRVWP